MALIAPDWNPAPRTLRGFGFVSLLFFGGLGAGTLWRGQLLGVAVEPATAQAVGIALGALGAISGVLAVIAPRALRAQYVILTAVTLPIGWVISHTALALLYFGVITPIGLVRRAVAGDPLERGIDRQAKSYWVRRPASPSIERYFRTF